MSDSANPLVSTAPHAWERLIESVEPAALLVLIEGRMNARLRQMLAPEDIFQEALLHAWRDRHRFEWKGLKSFRSWLLSIIDHRIQDEADRQAAGKRTAPGPIVPLLARDGGAGTDAPSGEGLPAGSTTPSKVAMYREHSEAMKRALEGLSDEHRDIVRLRLFEQLPLEEIAERSGLGVQAIRHRFRKGSEIYLRRLKAALGSRSATGRTETATTGAKDSSPPGG